MRGRSSHLGDVSGLSQGSLTFAACSGMAEGPGYGGRPRSPGARAAGGPETPAVPAAPAQRPAGRRG
ncbi:hypothetical protein JYU34_016236 [Plutella xylostella]|uniref:Lipoprotein n=1 Tax=Plutella xylostella TaxID=51655 RepID=A0ABQ7Q304_PLUXY|nr:hypothetical protein JYU34_016236 [Plutella xylostella]